MTKITLEDIKRVIGALRKNKTATLYRLAATLSAVHGFDWDGSITIAALILGVPNPTDGSAGLAHINRVKKFVPLDKWFVTWLARGGAKMIPALMEDKHG